MAQRSLVEPAELAAYLGIEEEDYPSALDPVRLGVVAFLHRLIGRAKLPFSDAITGRVEYHDGTGDALLWLDYPLGALTSITVGANHAAPDETLVVNDPSVLSFLVGERVIERLDGGTFGTFDATRAVRVTYTTEDDLPDDARLACCRLIAQLWGQRGAEDASQENVAGYSRTMADLAANDALWAQVVRQYQRPVFR